MDAMTNPELRIDLRQLVFAIAHAIDLVGVDDFFHGRRVGMMAAELGKLLGFDSEVCGTIYEAGLLHDCGVSSTRVHRRLVEELEWEGQQAHCDRGYALLLSYPPLAHLAEFVLHHHRRWSALQDDGIDPQVALISNLIHLADRVDVLAAPHYADRTLLSQVAQIRDRIAACSGMLFAPRLVELFLVATGNEAFWLRLSPDSVRQYQDDVAHQARPTVLSWVDFKGCADLFARIIDAKSSFTVEHSFGVARLARFLAECVGLPGVRCEMVEVAGLLHDIGKLQIPDEILESPKALSQEEFDVMKSHSYATFQVLKRLGGIDDIAAWAGLHHESLDGSGYPFHAHAGDIPIEARIIKVADIFQALAQNRPYRSALDAATILRNLVERVEAGLVDAEIVKLVGLHLETCLKLATAGRAQD